MTTPREDVRTGIGFAPFKLFRCLILQRAENPLAGSVCNLTGRSRGYLSLIDGRPRPGFSLRREMLLCYFFSALAGGLVSSRVVTLEQNMSLKWDHKQMPPAGPFLFFWPAPTLNPTRR